MAIVGEPCNVDAHANIPDLFMTNCDCTIILLTDQSIASIPGHHQTLGKN